MKPTIKALAFLSLPLLWSCSSDVPVAKEPNPSGEVVNRYLAIDITDVNNTFGTKAGNSSDDPIPDYEPADKDNPEHKISHGVFFFFHEDGSYHSTGFIKKAEWNEPGEGEDENDNIEYLGKNIVTVPFSYESQADPKYMITLLNHGSSIPEYVHEQKLTMQQTGQLIAGYDPEKNKGTDQNGFMMSTSSYHSGETGSIEKVYYTEIDGKYFKKSLTDAASDENTDILKIYVERLAAKVSLKVKQDNEGVVKDGDYPCYPISGAYYVKFINPDLTGDALLEGDNINYTTQLYARFEGWGLCGTARDSYISKQTDASWSMDWFNRKDDHRSFWGMGKFYSTTLLSEYNYLGYTDKIAPPYALATHSLRYYTWNDINATPSDDLYCLEHTASPDKYTKDGKLVSKNLTCVMLKSTLGIFENGKFQPLDVISYDGYLIPKEQFKAYMLNELNKTGRLNYYHMETIDGKETYTQVGEDEFEYDLNYKDTGKGTGKLKLIYTGTGTLYKKDIYGTDNENEGQYKDVYIPYPAGYDIEKAINGWGSAVAYTGGAMFYYIPIRHNKAAVDLSKLNNQQLRAHFAEIGNYGVVRNHHYDVTVNNIKNIGCGVFKPGKDGDPDPGEPLIPDDPEPQNHIKAEIRVLSWKLVNQNVDL